MIIDINKELYCIDNEDGKKYKIDGIHFPLGKPSGKDMSIHTSKVVTIDS